MAAIATMYLFCGPSVTQAEGRHRAAAAKSTVHAESAQPIFSFQGEDTETSVDVSGQVTCGRMEGEFECFYSEPQRPQVTVAGQRMKQVRKSYNAASGKLFYIAVTMDKSSYPDVLSAFTEKYGAPSSVDAQKWESKSGATFDNSVTVWRFKGGNLELDSMGEDVDSSGFHFLSTVNAPAGPKPKVDF